MAMELGEHGVRVNSVSPGAIATGIFGKALGIKDANKADALADRMESTFATMQPIPRSGMPDDIAQCVCWLASDRSTFVNGEDVNRPGRSACLTQLRSVSAVQPIFDAIEPIAAHSEAYSPRCSNTIRTARDRTSGENLLLVCFIMAPSSQELEPPANPERFTLLARAIFLRKL